ncbi:MAG TPA: transcriptional regulator [Burkholderiaceae bacterium]|nr:transcriptional regulator [Burkholderiaceae bacterium]
MTEVAQLVATIKRELKRRGLTYRDVGRALSLSEPSVKRLFASGRFTVARLSEVSGLLGITLAELVQESAAAAPRLQTLTPEQERRLVSDPKLLLVAVCALNNWSLDDITTAYRFTQAECLKRLLLLDRMGLIELLPGNRVRPKVARDFDWLPHGPIRHFFRTQGQPEFLAGSFDQQGEALFFVQAMLTDPARNQLEIEVRRLRARFAALHEECVRAPLDRKHGIGMLVATRGWEPAGFSELRRRPGR